MRKFALHLVSTVIAVLPLLAVVSCEKPQGGEPAGVLSLSKTSTTLNNSAQQTDFMIISKVAWTLSSADGWIHPDIASGNAQSTVKITLNIDKNEGDGRRTGTVSIKADGVSKPYVFTVKQDGTNILTGINQWVYETLSDWYYWDDELRSATVPSNSLAYDAFLNELLENTYEKGAEDDSENPPTIDGVYTYNNGGYTREAGHHYSYIDRFSAGTRAGTDPAIFGFDVMPVSNIVPSDPDRYGLLVTRVTPGSPADGAGLERGIWIYEWDESTNANGYIYWSDYVNFFYRLHALEGGTTLNLTDDGGTTYDLTAVSMPDDPIIFHGVVNSPGGTKVAYLMYNSFEAGTGDVYDDELRNIFGGFKAQGATELVLDLRYNGGGMVTSSQLLSSLAGNVNSGNTFLKTLYNDYVASELNVSNPELWPFLNESNSLGLNKIYVLGTNSTASASELVVNSLRGVDLDVVLIGERTNGKNVGMNGLEHTVGGYRYELTPITFKGMNAKNFCDYAGGFMPDFEKDELFDVLHMDGVLYPFGNENELLLKAALQHIDTGAVTPDPATRASAAVKKVSPQPKDPRHTGMIIYRSPKEAQ